MPSESTVVPVLIANVKDTAKLIGKEMTIMDKVYCTKDMGSMILLNVGAAYSDNPITVVMRGDTKDLATKIELNRTPSFSGKALR